MAAHRAAQRARGRVAGGGVGNFRGGGGRGGTEQGTRVGHCVKGKMLVEASVEGVSSDAETRSRGSQSESVDRDFL